TTGPMVGTGNCPVVTWAPRSHPITAPNSPPNPAPTAAPPRALAPGVSPARASCSSLIATLSSLRSTEYHVLRPGLPSGPKFPGPQCSVLQTYRHHCKCNRLIRLVAGKVTSYELSRSTHNS